MFSALIQYLILERKVRFTGKKFKNIKNIFLGNNYCKLQFNAVFLKE